MSLSPFEFTLFIFTTALSPNKIFLFIKFDFIHLYCDNINMDISISNITANKLNSIQEIANIKLLKSTLELQKDMATQIIEAMKVPDIGQNVDLRV